MGLWSGKPQSILLSFLVQNNIEELNVSREKTRAKNKESRE
jgi:hypothetical protein